MRNKQRESTFHRPYLLGIQSGASHESEGLVEVLEEKSLGDSISLARGLCVEGGDGYMGDIMSDKRNLGWSRIHHVLQEMSAPYLVPAIDLLESCSDFTSIHLLES